jgi:cell wall-associated NlpC family hydrolase
MKYKLLFLISCLFCSIVFASQQNKTSIENSFAITRSIEIDQLENFQTLPAKTQKLIIEALKLTKQNLTYQYGSASPKQGGMDCSGTIYYLLTTMGVTDPPRDSQGMYTLAFEKKHFHPVKEANFASPDFAELKPGDLLFWTGTYTKSNSSDATHVMLYLGKDKSGKPLMFGSSDGRRFRGERIRGVSVFDFELPQATSSARFIGYSCIDNYNC